MIESRQLLSLEKMLYMVYQFNADGVSLVSLGLRQENLTHDDKPSPA